MRDAFRDYEGPNSFDWIGNPNQFGLQRQQYRNNGYTRMQVALNGQLAFHAERAKALVEDSRENLGTKIASAQTNADHHFWRAVEEKVWSSGEFYLWEYHGKDKTAPIYVRTADSQIIPFDGTYEYYVLSSYLLWEKDRDGADVASVIEAANATLPFCGFDESWVQPVFQTHRCREFFSQRMPVSDRFVAWGHSNPRFVPLLTRAQYRVALMRKMQAFRYWLHESEYLSGQLSAAVDFMRVNRTALWGIPPGNPLPTGWESD